MPKTLSNNMSNIKELTAQIESGNFSFLFEFLPALRKYGRSWWGNTPFKKLVDSYLSYVQTRNPTTDPTISRMEALSALEFAGQQIDPKGHTPRRLRKIYEGQFPEDRGYQPTGK